MATIKDIARELNIGVSTVSMALNNNSRISEETRQKVLDKAKELKYVRNSAALELQKRKSNLILIVVNDPTRSFFAKFINCVQSAIAKHGYDCLIATTYEGHDETAKRYIREHRADAVIIYTGTISDEFILENASEDFPIFVFGRKLKGKDVYSFFNQTDAQGAQGIEVVNYLVSKGHRKIGFVKGSPYSLGTKRKYMGYMYGMCAHGLQVDERHVFDANGSSRKDGYQITEKILPRIKNLDALIYSNDEIAIGGMECLKNHNISIPDQISIVGQNNSLMGEYVSPKLTSYGSVSDENYTEKVVDALIGILENNDVIDQIQELEKFKGDSKMFERETVKDRFN